MNNLLEVTNLNKSYNNFSLENVSFSVPEDCVAGFIGTNGTGKTTTIRTILGLTQKNSGTIKIFGKDLKHNSQELKNRIGIVLDDGCFYDELSMSEMKSIVAPAYSHWDDGDYKNYMERFSLNPRQKIGTLSKGMKMKYALALALSHHADLLIMDEPTSGLDPLVRSEFMDMLIDYMKQGGKGIFFSTHITSDLDKIADILIFINKGKIIFEQDKDALLDTFHIVKGDKNQLNNDILKLFLNVQISDYNFKGITNKLSEVKRMLPDILVERPTIEDIMLGFIKGGQK